MSVSHELIQMPGNLIQSSPISLEHLGLLPFSKASILPFGRPPRPSGIGGSPWWRDPGLGNTVSGRPSATPPHGAAGS